MGYKITDEKSKPMRYVVCCLESLCMNRLYIDIFQFIICIMTWHLVVMILLWQPGCFGLPASRVSWDDDDIRHTPTAALYCGSTLLRDTHPRQAELTSLEQWEGALSTTSLDAAPYYDSSPVNLGDALSGVLFTCKLGIAVCKQLLNAYYGDPGVWLHRWQHQSWSPLLIVIDETDINFWQSCGAGLPIRPRWCRRVPIDTTRLMTVPTHESIWHKRAVYIYAWSLYCTLSEDRTHPINSIYHECAYIISLVFTQCWATISQQSYTGLLEYVYIVSQWGYFLTWSTSMIPVYCINLKPPEYGCSYVVVGICSSYFVCVSMDITIAFLYLQCDLYMLVVYEASGNLIPAHPMYGKPLPPNGPSTLHHSNRYAGVPDESKQFSHRTYTSSCLVYGDLGPSGIPQTSGIRRLRGRGSCCCSLLVLQWLYSVCVGLVWPVIDMTFCMIYVCEISRVVYGSVYGNLIPEDADIVVYNTINTDCSVISISDD